MSVAMMNGILQGLQAAQDRAMKISAARGNKMIQDQQLKIGKQKLKLLEKEQEASGQVDPFLKMIIDQQNDIFKAQEAESRVQDNQMNNALSAEQDKMNKLKALGQNLIVKGMQAGGGYVPNPEGAGALSALPRKPEPRKSPLGAFDWSYNTKSGGMTIKPKASDTRDIIGVSPSGDVKKMGEAPKSAFIIKTDGGENIALPATITKFSEAVKYLQSKGMTEEEATKKAEELL